MIDRIRLRNFRRYRDATLRFETGVNLIEGENNVGKTTLFYAIEYALFGRVDGFKTIRALMQPGKKSLGVELVFRGQKDERYLLQRVHQTPAKGKKTTLDGYFTLKEILDDGERYLLASDFGDTEDKLALKMREITGLTRRLFSVALHMRQGELPSILDGAKQLDIVLGVTAAAIAEDELRQMALEFEKESAALPVLRERLRSVGNELTKVTEELAALHNERETADEKLKAMGVAADPRAELEKQLTPLMQKLAAFEEIQKKAALTQQRLEDEKQRGADVLKAGSKETVEKELTNLTEEAVARTKTLEKLRGELEQATDTQRKLDTQRGDLVGRIERRKNLPKGKGAKCEVCGAPIKAAETAKELADWTAELEQLDKTLADSATQLKKLQTSANTENAAERKQLERVTQLTRQREQLTQLEAKLTERQKQFDDATAAQASAFASIQSESRTVAQILKVSKYEVQWNLDGEPAVVLASIREGIQSLRQALAERVGQQIAERKALADLLARFDTQLQNLQRRQSDLERDQAAARAEAAAQEVKAAHAARFRGISAGFKEFQVQLRSDAATKLAADTIKLHRQLSETDQFESLSIDPVHYSLQVTPRDLAEEVPAGQYEGGGHRLLLGLAYRLAVARLVAHCPFLLLDEPTYGLDTAHRDTLLNRVGNQEVAKQILLVTHQALGTIPGNRVKVARKEKESIVVE